MCNIIARVPDVSDQYLRLFYENMHIYLIYLNCLNVIITVQSVTSSED